MNDILRVGGRLVYAYLGTLLPVLGIYFLAIRHRNEAESFKPFDVTEVKSKSGTRSELRSGLASGTIMIVVMLCLLMILVLIAELIGSFIAVLFLLLGVSLARGFISDLPLEKIPGVSNRPRVLRGLKIVLTLMLGTAWYFFPSWLTYDVLILASAYTFLTRIGAVSLTFIATVLMMLIIFDILGVFVTGLIPKLATGLDIIPPMLLLLPQNPLSLDMRFLTGLGMGDILIPGMAIMTAHKYRMHRSAMAGYAVGLLLLYPLLFLLRQGLPALMTLVPCMLGAIFIHYLILQRSGKWVALQEAVVRERQAAEEAKASLPKPEDSTTKRTVTIRTPTYALYGFVLGLFALSSWRMNWIVPWWSFLAVFIVLFLAERLYLWWKQRRIHSET